MPAAPRPLFDRWNEKVDRTTGGCWIWKGAVKDTGYGVIQRGSRGMGTVRAHRFAYEHYVGTIPDGMELRHSCHNRRCVNPEHLSPGTRLDNMRDMVEAGRWTPREPRRGELDGNAKLTATDVLEIRASSGSGPQLASRYGVSRTTISEIRLRKTWRHI